MRKLFILLLLPGCSCAVDPKHFPNLGPKEKEEAEDWRPVQPKYETPNEFTLKNGCKVRVRTYLQNSDRKIIYPVSVPLNEWSDDCSEAPDMVKEEDIVKARYKK